MTAPHPEDNRIIVCGRRVKLANEDVRVVNFAHPAGRAFAFPPDARAKRRQGVDPMDWDKTRELVHMVVIHTDLTSTSADCFKQLALRNLSTHFMIDWDGTIYQGADLGYQTFHGGSTNRVSIGIDMNNKMPNLANPAKADLPPYPAGHEAYDSRRGADWPYRRPKSRLKRFNFGRVKSYGYTDAQYRALVALLTTLTQEGMFKRIKRIFPMGAKGEVIPNVIEGAEEFEGILGHMHVSANRWDPGPGFDWHRVMAGMLAENNSFPILLKGGDNIGGLLERAKVKRLAQKYFLLNERGKSDGAAVETPAGGWYPMSTNQTWHGGIHLQAPAKTPVLAMFEGKLVAARFNKCDTRLGSNNFVVLRHEVDLPRRDEKTRKKTLIFYSLYMHLEYIDVFSQAAQNRYDWVEKLRAAKTGAGGDTEFAVAGSDCPQTRPQRHGPGLGFLREGGVAWFEYKKHPIIVQASSPIAPIGWFDPSGGKNVALRQVHVEVFADDRWRDAVDMAVHGQFFTELQQADGADRSLFVKNRRLLAAFGPRNLRPKNSLVKARVLSQQEITDVFTIDEPGNLSLRRRFRKIVVKHVSEWSDQVDWVKALSQAQDWKGKTKDYGLRIRESGLFKTTLERALPFIWLDGEVAQAIGLRGGGKEWTGQLWHFHPIHFLMWLTFHSAQRVQTLSRSVSKAEHKKLKDIERRINANIHNHIRQTSRALEDGASLDDVEVGDIDIHHILDDFMTSDDVGEW